MYIKNFIVILTSIVFLTSCSTPIGDYTYAQIGIVEYVVRSNIPDKTVENKCVRTIQKGNVITFVPCDKKNQ